MGQKMKRSDTICVLDIGSTKVCCCIANVSKGYIDIRGIGYCSCTGIVSGVIVEMESVCKSISTAVELAEAQARSRVKSAYVSISGKNVISRIDKCSSEIGGRLVTQEDINKMLYRETQVTPGHVIIHKIPIMFTIDDLPGIKNPVGMVADLLECQMSVIEAPKAQVNNLFVCLSKSHIEVDGIVASPYASGLAMCQENDDRIIVIEVGGSTTSVSFWYNGAFSGVKNVPIGGGHLTLSLSKELGISYADAERLKVLYGSAISYAYESDENVMAAVLDENDVLRMQQVSKSSINNIVQEKVAQLADLLNNQISESEFNDFSKKLVLTGGGSQMPGIADLMAMKLKKNILQRDLKIYTRDFTPNYATTIGLLKYAVHDKLDTLPEKEDGFDFEDVLQKLMNFFKKN